MKKKLLTIVSALMLVLAGTLYFGNQTTEAYTTYGEAQGFQFETGKYQADAEQPFSGNNWNGNSGFIGTSSSKLTQVEIPFSSWGGYIVGNILIDKNGILYPYHSKQLMAITKQGQVIWTYNVSDNLRGQPVITEDGIIYLLDGSSLIAIDSQNGTLKWKVKGDELYYNKFDGVPAIDNDGTIYVTNDARNDFTDDFIGKKSILYAYNPNGSLKWKTGNVFDQNLLHGASPIISKNGVIYNIYEKGISAHDKNGNLLWKKLLDFKTSGYSLDNSGNILVAGDMGTFAAKLVKLDPNGNIIKEVNLRQEAATFYDYNAKPVVNKKTGYIYLGLFGQLKIFDKDLNQVGSQSFYNMNVGNALIDNEGNVILPTSNDYHIKIDEEVSDDWYPGATYKLDPLGNIIWEVTNDLLSHDVVIDKNGLVYTFFSKSLHIIGEPAPQVPSCSGFWEKLESALDNKTMTREEVEYNKQKLQQMINDLNAYEQTLNN